MRKLTDYSWYTTSEDWVLAREFAVRDLKYGNSHECSGGLDERILGHLGEIGYKKLFGYPVGYHDPFGVDIEQENVQLKTRSLFWHGLYIRKEAFGHFEWRHVLIAPLIGHDCKFPFSETILPEFFEIKGWATLDMFLKFGRETNLDNGRDNSPIWLLEQGQLLKRETIQHE